MAENFRFRPTINKALIALWLIVLAGALLRFYPTNGETNLYYTAAVKSMSSSLHNFFFVAAEPGASVTVDKPPLGLWLQVFSAAVFGLTPFGVTFPQIASGVLSIVALYHLVKRDFGFTAGLLAALTLAVMPVAIATERTNTMDGTLVLVLLLAAWAFMRAAENGRWKNLALGAVLVGLGFNIKMLQAFLPLPAFYGLYLLCAPLGWRRKGGYLAGATVVLVVVSMVWVMAVDLTPADERPYIGSSQSNSALELTIGYNGVGRLLGMQAIRGNQIQPPNGNNGAGNGNPARPDGNRNNAPGFAGVPGVLRLVQQPLDRETSWLLPLTLVGLGMLIFRRRIRLPIDKEKSAVVLWGGWLVIGLVFFSAARFYHDYYLIMIGPPIAALVGISYWVLRDMAKNNLRQAGILLVVGTGITFGYQLIIVRGYNLAGGWLTLVGLGLAVCVGIWGMGRRNLALVGAIGMLLVTPTIWSVLTAVNPNANAALPTSFSGQSEEQLIGFGGRPFGAAASAELVNYLEANTQGMEYLLAVPSANAGDNFIMETGRPVLLAGGFVGTDPVLTVDKLTKLVSEGRLRYLLDGFGNGFRQDVREWLSANCAAVPPNVYSGNQQPSQMILYDCATSDSPV